MVHAQGLHPQQAVLQRGGLLFRRRPALYWVLAANGLVLLAVGVKTGVVFKGGTEAQEEAVEGE